MESIKKGPNKFYIGEDSQNVSAEITFVVSVDNNEIIIDHTYVSPALRGQGIALELVKKVIEYAREQNKKIIPSCSYAYRVMSEEIDCEDIWKRE